MKIIFCDVDGTLYNYEGIISDSTKKALYQLKENGNLVYLATGRSKAENKDELLEIGFDGMICGNGCYVEDHGKQLYHKTISLSDLDRILKWFKKRDLVFLEETNAGLFASEHLFEVAKPKIIKPGCDQFVDMFDDMIEGQNPVRDDINKISFFLNSMDDYYEAKKEFPDLYVGGWGNGGDLLFGEFGNKDIDKASGVKLLVETMGYDVKDTIALGDGSQDIPMFKYCNLGISFTSASKDAQDAADYISDDIACDGFYKAFKHFNLI